jgi:hypothetical protein
MNARAKGALPEMTLERALAINGVMLKWLAVAHRQAVRGGASPLVIGSVRCEDGDVGPQWGFRADGAGLPRYALGDLIRARWVLRRAIREGRLRRETQVMSEACICAVIVMRDAPEGLPLLVAGGRALAVGGVR